MGAIDNLISIAAERKTFLTSEKIIRLSRLIISLDKIINSFKENANNPIAPQMVHIQIIEDILYKDPHFFDDELIEHFFSLKNDLDAEIATFPFDSNKHKPIFDDLKERGTLETPFSFTVFKAIGWWPKAMPLINLRQGCVM